MACDILALTLLECIFGNVKIIVALRAILINKLPFVNLPFERGKILFSKGFSILASLGMASVMVSDKRRQQASRVDKSD